MKAILPIFTLIFLLTGVHLVQSQVTIKTTASNVFVNPPTDSTAMTRYFKLKSRALAAKDSAIVSRDSLKVK